MKDIMNCDITNDQFVPRWRKTNKGMTKPMILGENTLTDCLVYMVGMADQRERVMSTRRKSLEAVHLILDWLMTSVIIIMFIDNLLLKTIFNIQWFTALKGVRWV